MAVEGQQDAKNAALILSVRTLTDSKLGVDLFRGSASLELYRELSSKKQQFLDEISTKNCCNSQGDQRMIRDGGDDGGIWAMIF
ncbi:hypothetical protein C4D60_Mb00t02200 [Musa balbisiana]|uniref:Uncharacterized protein n=1 Tax=Musa balbisiana TaxID=52838 RepID=A0A4S8I5L0_MUSBA|nr:hypothetical protein C4D60_Mb00t02200 [Musa balbisiana]